MLALDISEDALHAQAVEFLTRSLPSDALLHHSPNEGKRSCVTGRRLKQKGMRTGWPDLEVLYEGRAYFIELKTRKGVVQPAQKAVHEQLRAAGCLVAVCRSLEDVYATLVGWGIPLRARPA